MGENTNQIEQEIRARREDLGRNLDELEDKARELADWRTHYRKHTGWFIGAAFGAGVVAGLTAISSSRRTPARPEPDLSHDPYRARHAWSSGDGTKARAVRHLGDTWGQIADALLRTASAKAIRLVGEFVPGFNEHLEPSNSTTGRVH
jgi:Protein of unknown function (DUF3618)